MADGQDHQRLRRWVLAATVSGGLGFLVLVFLVESGMSAGFDRFLLLLLRVPQMPDDPWGPDWFEEMAADFTALGGYPLLVFFGIVALGVLFMMKERAAGWYLVTAVLSGSVVSSLLKEVFSRPRPDLVAHADRVFTWSFPSGHAFVASVAWLTLAAVCLQFIQYRALRRFVACVAVVVVLVVGASRVYLGVHWPSDVMAGWAAGTAWAGFCWLVADWLGASRRGTADRRR